MTRIMMRSSLVHRRGITLLEVLISVGILAVGLGSVVALVPAARSQASRAVILDRAAALAANTLADAATFGLLRPSCLTNGGSRPQLIDPAGSSLSLTTGNSLPQGIYGSAGSGTAAPNTVQWLWAQSRDDISMQPAARADDPPTNVIADGTRSFSGRMTSLVCLQAGTNGGPDRMSVVVFHARDSGLLSLSGTLSGTVLTIQPGQSGVLGGRTVPEIIRPGIVLYANNQFHQVTSAVVTASGSNTFNAYLTFSSGAMLTTGAWAVQFLPDSVGFAERPFNPESTSPYLQ